MESGAALKDGDASDAKEMREQDVPRPAEPPRKRLRVDSCLEGSCGDEQPDVNGDVTRPTSSVREDACDSEQHGDASRSHDDASLSPKQETTHDEQNECRRQEPSLTVASVYNIDQPTSADVQQQQGLTNDVSREHDLEDDVDPNASDSDSDALSCYGSPPPWCRDGKYLGKVVNAHLYEAILDEDIEAVQNCLARGAHPDHSLYQDEEGYESALHAAVRRGRADIVKLLLEQKPKLTYLNQDNYTPLHLAAKIGNVEMCRMLLDSGAAVDGGDRPLCFATDNMELVHLLFASGSRANELGSHGDTALNVACKGGHWPVVMVLIRAGADVNVQSAEGVTPLMMAARRGHAEMVKFLLNSGASANVSNITGMTVLHDAALSEKGNCVLQVLIEAGCDIEVRCERNQTPLIYAIQFIRPDAVCQLIQANCKICYSVYTFGHHFTPFQMAFLQCEQMASSAGSGARLKEKECNRVCSLLRIMRMLVCAGAKVSSPTISVHKGLQELTTCAGFLESRGYGRDPRNSVEMLVQALKNPHSLAELTRTKLRTLLGRDIKQKLSTVQLPEFIHNFILLSDLQGV